MQSIADIELSVFVRDPRKFGDMDLSGVRIIYGAGQMETVVREVARLGKRLLVVPTGSFLSGGHYAPLEKRLTEEGTEVYPLPAGEKPRSPG